MIKDCKTCRYAKSPLSESNCAKCVYIDGVYTGWTDPQPKIPAKLMNTTDKQFLPSRKHTDDAGADLRARIDFNICLSPGEMAKIPTGVALEIPKDHVGLVIARSGATTDGKVTLIGAVDSGYRGEIGMNVINLSKSFTTIAPKERLAQLIVIPCMIADFLLSDELSETDRSENGFGSTGRM